MTLLFGALPADAEPVRREADVVVSASRVPLPAKEIGSAVTVISEEELEQRQVRLVSDVLRDVPGVAVSRNGPVGSLTQIRLRGAESNQTLVLIDGIEVNNPSVGSDFDFGNLLNAEIARIEVLRGPQSALYGSDAIGGVINIVTKTPETGFSATARGEAGSFDTRTGLANFGFGSEMFDLSATLAGLTTRGFSVADEDDGNDEDDSYSNSTGRLKFGFRPLDILEFEGVGMVIDSERQNDASVAVDNIVDGEGEAEELQRYGLIKGKLTLFDGMWEHIARASHLDDETDFFDGNGNNTFTTRGQKDKFDYQTNLFLKTPEFAGAEHTLTFAAERERDEQFTDSAFSGPNTVDVVNYGYVGEYRLGLFDRLFLSGSVRHDDNDKLFDNETTYRGTAAYLLEETGSRLHGSVGSGVKNPTLFELFGSTPNFTGNPDLEAERSVGWDVGLEQTLLDGRLIVDVTYFQNRIKDFIQGGGNTAVNLSGTTKIQGVEVGAGFRPIESLRFDGSYTYSNGEDPDGKELIRRARHIASFNANYAFEVFERPGNVNLGFRFNGRQDDTVFNSFFPVQTRTETLDAYYLLNLSASYEVWDGIEIFARGENLLNDDYQEIFGFGSAGAAGYAGVQIKLGPY